MPRKVLILPDKFKGTLTAAAAARAIARGWRKARRRDRLQLLPMSDGGDGFGEVMSSALMAKPRKIKTVDAAHRPCTAAWWWEPKSRTAIIESARVIGLAMLPPGKFHPFQLDTFGLGAVVREAVAKGAKEILIGIGGSATNDGGFGLARALGWEFRDRAGGVITRWTDLHRLSEILSPSSSDEPTPDPSQEGNRIRHARRRSPPREGQGVGSPDIVDRPRITVAVDVQNPLLGPRGATRVYGPQKGIRPTDYAKAEKCLGQLARVAKNQFGKDCSRQPGAGAAGGLGFGLLAFLNARPEPGFELFASHTKLHRFLHHADLVVTAEGAIDRSTLMGKGTGQIARLSQQFNVPCIGLAGMTTHDPALDRLFAHVHALTDLTTPKAARSKPAFWLERLAREVAAGL